jgi:hypothetical protein
MSLIADPDDSDSVKNSDDEDDEEPRQATAIHPPFPVPFFCCFSVLFYYVFQL